MQRQKISFRIVKASLSRGKEKSSMKITSAELKVL